MGKMSEKELLSIIDRYGYDLKEETGCLVAIKRISPYVQPQHSPAFGRGGRYWQLKHIVMWIFQVEDN